MTKLKKYAAGNFVVGAKPNRLSAKAVKQISSAKMPDITKTLISRAAKANVKKGNLYLSSQSGESN